MNFLKQAITSQLSHSSHPSRKCFCLLHPLTQSSPYSTTYRLSNPQPRNSTIQKPQEPSPRPPPSSLTWSQKVKKRTKELTNWPRPSEIPYQAKVANLVNLIGHITTPIKFQSTPDGKYLSGVVISLGNDQDQSFTIPVVFEGDLAHVVASHVKKNDCVYVIGRLSEDPLPFVLYESQGKFHVVVENINFVQGFQKKAFEYGSKNNVVSVADGSTLSKDMVAETEHENDDNLKNSRKTLDSVNSKPKISQTSLKSADTMKDGETVSDSWRDLVKNPKQWRDYREQKFKGLVKEKYPDFKHKDDGTALWLDKAPKWVLSGLEMLDFDVNGNDDNLKHSRKTLDTVNSEPKISQTSLERADTMKDGETVFDSWRDLVKNPKQWWDYREQKFKGLVKEKYPDFKHKNDGTALWLNKAPKWVFSGLERLDIDVYVPQQKRVKDAKEEEFWKSLVENPNKWWDNRLGKKNAKAPDFKHKETGEVLWLNSSPDWVLSKLPPLNEQQNAATGKKNMQSA